MVSDLRSTEELITETAGSRAISIPPILAYLRAQKLSGMPTTRRHQLPKPSRVTLDPAIWGHQKTGHSIEPRTS